jgi:hypothetical protein
MLFPLLSLTSCSYYLQIGIDDGDVIEVVSENYN